MSGYEGEGTGIDLDLPDYSGPDLDFGGGYAPGDPRDPPDYSGPDLDIGGGYAPGDPRAGGYDAPTDWGKILSGILGGAGKGLGLIDAKGNINWAALMSALAIGGGAAYGINRTNKANEQMQQAIKDANAQITSTLGGNKALYKPYQDAGALGLQRMMNQPQSDLASRYKPLGTGAGFSLGSIARGQ